MLYNMALYELLPQNFIITEITQLPSIDFFNFARTQLPQVYQNASNFMGVLSTISVQKQKLYDIIRSLVNVFNLNNAGNGPDSAAPTGIYLQMLASVFNAPYSDGDSSLTIITNIKNAITFVNSRGRPSDFYQYFLINGLSQYFTNEGVEEDGNASIFFNLPISSVSTNPPTPVDIFLNSMNKLKAAGIEIFFTGSDISYFQPGSLPTDSPPFSTGPGNTGFGGLNSDGRVVGGGFFISV